MNRTVRRRTTLAEAYGPLRIRAFITYLGAGLVTLGVTLACLWFDVRMEEDVP